MSLLDAYRYGFVDEEPDMMTTDPSPSATEAAVNIDRSIAILTDALAQEFGYSAIRWFSVAALISETLTNASLAITAAPPSGQVCVDRALVADAADYIVPRGVQGHRIRNGLRAALTEGATV